MKIKRMIWVVLVMLLFTACGNDSERNEIVEKTKEEILIDAWVEKISTEAVYEEDFDTSSITKEHAENLIKIFKEHTYRVLDYSQDKILIMVVKSDGNIDGFLGYYIDENRVKASGDNSFITWFKDICCDACQGTGLKVIGSHMENGQYACGACGGAGYTWNQYYIGNSWQQQQIACGACGGSGWLNGKHVVNDYGKCEACKGLGVIKE